MDCAVLSAVEGMVRLNVAEIEYDEVLAFGLFYGKCFPVGRIDKAGRPYLAAAFSFSVKQVAYSPFYSFKNHHYWKFPFSRIL